VVPSKVEEGGTHLNGVATGKGVASTMVLPAMRLLRWSAMVEEGSYSSRGGGCQGGQERSMMRMTTPEEVSSPMRWRNGDSDVFGSDRPTWTRGKGRGGGCPRCGQRGKRGAGKASGDEGGTLLKGAW
jgi:hypothetical protein